MSGKPTLNDAADAAQALLAALIAAPRPEPRVEQIGTVEEVADGESVVFDGALPEGFAGEAPVGAGEVASGEEAVAGGCAGRGTAVAI